MTDGENIAFDRKNRGFTLLELLIVIAIIAVLSVILIIAINPAETLKKARDSQRLSDLGTLKTALGIYITSKTTPFLGGASSNAVCRDSGGAWTATDRIHYSLDSGTAITDTTLDGGTASAPAAAQVASANVPKTDSTGWIPVNLDSITGGSPISNLPVDPTNALGGADLVSSVTASSTMYRYVCRADNLTFEIDVPLESTAFTVDDNKMTKDGGNNSSYYEVGTNLSILGTGTDF